MRQYLTFGLLALASLSGASTLFYGGDFDGRSGGGAVNIGSDYQYTYDDFTLSADTTVRGLWGNFLETGSATATHGIYEIRSGVSAGNGGTLVATERFSILGNATGRSGLGLVEWRYAGDITPVALVAGTYWMSLAIDTTNLGDNTFFVSSTSGANSVGAPIGNGDSFVTTGNGAANFTPMDEINGPGPWDFSYGVADASVVPEPASFAVLGVGVLALMRRPRRAGLATRR